MSLLSLAIVLVVDYQGDDYVSNHLDRCNSEIARWIGSDCLEASVRLRLETVAHSKHLNILMMVLVMFMMQMMLVMKQMMIIMIGIMIVIIQMRMVMTMMAMLTVLMFKTALC